MPVFFGVFLLLFFFGGDACVRTRTREGKSHNVMLSVGGQRGGFSISSFCVVLAIKNTLFFDCEKSLSLIFGKPIKVCRSFHTGCGIENKCYILSPFPFELANYRVVKIKISL